MQYMAKWGPKGFLVSPTMVVPFADFSTSLTVKEESKEDASGTARINIRGRELRPISFSTTYLRTMGVDPRAQAEAWEAELGQSNPLYIGGKQIGTNQMMLTSVSTSDVKLSPAGEWISCKVSLTMKEYANGSETVSLITKTTTEKKAALTATAPKATKEKKKVPATHEQMVAAAGARRKSNARPR